MISLKRFRRDYIRPILQGFHVKEAYSEIIGRYINFSLGGYWPA